MNSQHAFEPRTVATRLSPQQEDAHALYKLYSIDFDAAQHTLRLLRRCRKPDTRHCLLRDATVAYCRPFSGNKGRILKAHVLSPKVVPAQLQDLHDELMRRRNGIIAHTDAEARDPQVSRWRTSSGYVYLLGFAHGNWSSLDRRADEMRSLIAAVSGNLNAMIQRLEAKI